jgi:Tfp pilus assembly protein PilF
MDNGEQRRKRPLTGALVVIAMFIAGCSGGSRSASTSTTTATQADEVSRLLETGVNQAQAKQFAQAQTTFQDVLALNPGNPYAWYNLGLIAQTENDPKTAVTDYQQAVKSDPSYTPAMYNEAIALEPSDGQAALTLYRQIVAINPKAATAYLRMSFLYDRLGDHTDAATARSKAIALDPTLGSVSPTTP